MESVILTSVLGVTFVLLGRWLYRNPNRLVPSWGIFNRENPGVKKVARAYATFFIFFGTLAVSVGLLRGPFAVVLGIPIAVAGVWFLRPRLPQPAPGVIGPVIDGPGEAAKKQSLLNEHWKRYLAIMVGLAILFALGISELIGNSEVSKLAFARVEANPIVRQRLVEPVKRGFFTSGSIEISGPSGRADISIPISGPKGKATVYAVAQKSAGLWRFNTLQVAFKEETERVDLLQQVTQPDQPTTQ